MQLLISLINNDNIGVFQQIKNRALLLLIKRTISKKQKNILQQRIEQTEITNTNTRTKTLQLNTQPTMTWNVYEILFMDI